MEILQYLITRCNMVGSRDICPETATDNTDHDYLMLANPIGAFFVRIVLYLNRYKRRHGGITYFNPIPVMTQTAGFQVWKSIKNNITVDVLLTTDKGFYDKFMEAHNEAKRLKILDKAERLVLFQKIIYDHVITVEDMQKYLDAKIQKRNNN